MTPQENQKLHHFLAQLIQVRNTPKDGEAQELINAAVARQPDAAYLLVQRALILEAALDGARAQIAELQDRLQGAPSRGYGGSFLSDEDAWGNSARTATAQPRVAQGYAAPPQASGMEPTYGQAPYSSQGGWGTGSFLGSMAATAAGVAGGAFLYRGLEGMFSHREAPAHGYASSPDSGTSSSGSASDSSLARDAGLNNIGSAGVADLDQRARQDDSAGLMDDVGNDDVIPDDPGSGDDDSFI
ncbi:DUF2076 domain-containing protein [Noviherbaspirillum pedocola]|uniref:DUF2076 family protein n=1 Tax=Noviherbaspirillum pedocola TaxID=2801341 RepID=A0A934SS56_9BURK|nr:DUF2076 family protein [Noviherbaspirillum pedocola]MBK4735766.1 DUF2076 family protein [Noviherbaspirillum pedocola]